MAKKNQWVEYVEISHYEWGYLMIALAFAASSFLIFYGLTQVGYFNMDIAIHFTHWQSNMYTVDIVFASFLSLGTIIFLVFFSQKDNLETIYVQKERDY